MRIIHDRFTAKAARLAAEDTLLELAAQKPPSVAQALLDQPEVFRALNFALAKQLLLLLLQHEQHEALRRLLGLRAIGARKAKLLAELLLHEAFRQ